MKHWKDYLPIDSKPKTEEKVGISLPSPAGSLVDIEEFIEKEEEIEELAPVTLCINLAEIIKTADPFDDRSYLPLQEISAFEQEIEETQTMWLEEDEVTEPIIYCRKNKDIIKEHDKELRHLSVFCTSLFAMGLLPYTTPALADYRPWVEGEKAPLLGLWTGDEIVTEAHDGSLMAVTVEKDPEEEELAMVAIEEAVQEEEELAPLNEIAKTEIDPADYFEPLQPRSPARPEGLFIPEGALDDYFTKLSIIEDGTDHVARALVWGDSTIANDGIIKDIRKRMQTRFGDAGPGFLAAQIDPRWAFRRDIVRKSSGTWKSKTIVYGGAEDSRYGLAGTVSKAHPDAQATLGGVKKDGKRQDLHRFQVFYQKNPNGGNLKVSTQSKALVLETKAEQISDSYYELTVPSGDQYVYLSVEDAPITIYGIAMEVDAPGVTWETFGVAGSSIASMQKQHDGHIANQIRARDPSLLVYWTGGNELGYPSVRSKSGKVYKRIYRKVVQGLREGAPSASCLLIGPLDQGTRNENGQVVSKPTLDNIIRFQREVAEEEGCAFWDARAAMGGKDSFSDWLNHSPSMASPDLAHLTGRGRKRIGDSLADVLMREYDIWRLQNPDIFWEPEESPQGSIWEMDVWECDRINLTINDEDNFCSN